MSTDWSVRGPQLQALVNRLHVLFTSPSDEIAQQFGESRVRCDSDRVNYALEWLIDHVTDEPDPIPLSSSAANEER